MITLLFRLQYLLSFKFWPQTFRKGYKQENFGKFDEVPRTLYLNCVATAFVKDTQTKDITSQWFWWMAVLKWPSTRVAMWGINNNTNCYFLHYMILQGFAVYRGLPWAGSARPRQRWQNREHGAFLQECIRTNSQEISWVDCAESLCGEQIGLFSLGFWSLYSVIKPNHPVKIELWIELFHFYRYLVMQHPGGGTFWGHWHMVMKNYRTRWDFNSLVWKQTYAFYRFIPLIPLLVHSLA